MNPAEIAHGPMLIGLLFNVLLYGMMIIQVYLYYTSYPRDSTFMKIFVLVILIADTVNVVFDFIYIYNSLILNFGDFAHLSKADWVFSSDAALTGIIASLVQSFFAWRVRIMTKNWWYVVPIFLTSLASLLGSVATSIFSTHAKFEEFRNFQQYVIIWLVGAAACDVLITAILVAHLRNHKTGFKATDALVDRIIHLTIQTGLVTCVCAVIDLILYLTSPTGLHLIFNFPLSKLYSNSLMSSLNSRDHGRHTSTSVHTCSNSSANQNGLMVQSNFNPQRNSVANSIDQSKRSSVANSARSVGRSIRASLLGPTHPASVFVTVESERHLDAMPSNSNQPAEDPVTALRNSGDLEAGGLTLRQMIHEGYYGARDSTRHGVV